jgi:type IV pilus assembly protein PilA
MLKKLGLKLKSQNGFTLIELLAVIVILGIIAAIAVPTITGVINKSKNDAMVAEALQILDAARLAYTDNNAVTSWDYDPAAATPEPLSDYISKLKDKDFTVTYNTGTNVFSIVDHEAVGVTGVDADTNGTLTEDELANAAR